MDDPVEECYCQAARRSARFLSRAYDRHLAPAGISVQQLGILSGIYHDPGVTIAALAERMVMERTTLVRALKPLQDAGFVASERAARGRSLALTVTPNGRKKLAQGFPLWQAAQREFEEQFGARRASGLRETLRQTVALS